MRRVLAALAIATMVLSSSTAFFAAPAFAVEQAQIKLQIPIPGSSSVENAVDKTASNVIKDLPSYISNVYNFLISIVGVVAAISMVYGGFLWMTSGGASDRAKAGKKRIGDSVIGMILALCSFIMLNTINPDLVAFKPLVIQTVTQEKADYSKILGGTLGTPCKTDAECTAPLTCLIVKEAPLETAINTLGQAIGVALTLPAGGGAAVAGGGKLLFGGAKLALKYAGKAIFTFSPKSAVVGGLIAAGTTAAAGTAAGVGYLSWKELSDLGYKGVCAQEAFHEVPKGSWCSKDTHCMAGMRCIVDPGISNICVGCGVCSDMSNGSFCQPHSTDQCGSGSVCVDSGTGVWFCSSGAKGDKCTSNSDCRVSGLTCQDDKSGSGIHVCAGAPQATGSSCKSAADCQGDQKCIAPTYNQSCKDGGLACICVPISLGTSGSPCYCNDQCQSQHCVTSSGKEGPFQDNYCVDVRYSTVGACK